MTLRPFVGLVPSDDVLARSVAGSERGAERLARRATHPRHVSWLEGGDIGRPADVDAWIADGSLRPDDRPRLRLLVQRLLNGTEVIGLVGLVALADLVPHEGTDAMAVRRRVARDRLQQVDSRPLLTVLPADPPGLGALLARIRATAPELDVADEVGIRHTSHVVPDDVAEELVEALAAMPCLLADGHHRVAAAAELGRTTMPALLTFAGHAPQMMPVWRLAAVTRSGTEVVGQWLEGLGNVGSVEVRFDRRVRRVATTDDELPVVASQRVAESVPGVQRVTSTSNVNAVVVAERDGAVVVGAPAPTVTDILGAVANGRPLPPKSTAFHPKPRVGLVMHRVPGT